MITDPILCLTGDNDRLQFVRSSSGHAVHLADVAREGFQCSPDAAAIILQALLKAKVPTGPEIEEVTP